MACAYCTHEIKAAHFLRLYNPNRIAPYHLECLVKIAEEWAEMVNANDVRPVRAKGKERHDRD